jgi:phosphoribosylcarboxyaminoimidazole (NCAIR) mutase
MNPLALAGWLDIITSALAMIPALKADYDALVASGKATPEQLAELDAKIKALDSQRMISWADADAALSKAGG